MKHPSEDMSASNEHEEFRTLRGFLAGEEPDEKPYFCFSATLRIVGTDVPLDEISKHLGMKPTFQRRKGERRGSRSLPFVDDGWFLESGLAETEPLERHLLALWAVVRPNVQYLKSLKERFTVDVFCGYRSNCDHAGFEVPHQCLELFTALEIPLGVSVIIA
ncbi:MAG: DUF4279 domain-containing protein [Planctomycetaceae bacterium]